MNALLITFLSISIYYLGEIYNTQLRIKTSYRKAFIVHSFIYKRNFNLYKIKNIKLTRFLVSTILEYNVYLVIITLQLMCSYINEIGLLDNIKII